MIFNCIKCCVSFKPVLRQWQGTEGWIITNFVVFVHQVKVPKCTYSAKRDVEGNSQQKFRSAYRFRYRTPWLRNSEVWNFVNLWSLLNSHYLWKIRPNSQMLNKLWSSSSSNRVMTNPVLVQNAQLCQYITYDVILFKGQFKQLLNGVISTEWQCNVSKVRLDSSKLIFIYCNDINTN
jgi:hypothetical protein